MSNNNDIKDIKDDKEGISTEKKKQKPGLNAVRPDDFVEGEFKDLAKKNKISQTDLFVSMFWNYIRDGRGEKRENAISFDGELGLLSKDLENIMVHFKAIANKSQDTVISLKSNSEQIEKNFNLEIETLNLKLVELTNRNTELENTNKVFSEVREGLELKISNLASIIVEKETENKKILGDMKEKTIEIKLHEKTIVVLEKDKKGLDIENSDLLEKITLKDSKLRNIEATNVSLQNTVNSMESLRKSEISSIEARYKTEIAALSSKINVYNGEKEKELKRVKASLKSEYGADKKMALAEVILQLADMKGKYAEHQSDYNELQIKFNKLTMSKTITQ